MKLDASIRQSIFHYPSLFRVRNNTTLSRLLVLEHMFCVIGNGYEWHPTGYLAPDGFYKAYDKQRFRRLPKDYFDKELYEFQVSKENIGQLKDALQEYYWYKSDRVWATVYNIKVETDRQTAKQLAEQFGIDHYAQKAERCDRWLDNREVDIDPYPMCGYSALVELVNGKTNSPHLENFSLDGVVQADYIEGAVEIAKEILKYYSDAKRYKWNDYYPGNANGFMCMSQWENFVEEQTGFCKTLLEKYRSER